MQNLQLFQREGGLDSGYVKIVLEFVFTFNFTRVVTSFVVNIEGVTETY